MHVSIKVYKLQISLQMKEEENAPQRIGSKPFSRFGSCVAAVGDLDGDGYEGTVHYTLHFHFSDYTN